MLCVVPQIRVFGGNWTYDPQANSLAYNPLDYKGTQFHFISRILKECTQNSMSQFNCEIGKIWVRVRI